MLGKKLLLSMIFVSISLCGYESIYLSLANCKTKEVKKDIHYKKCGHINDIYVTLEETNKSKSITLTDKGIDYPQKFWASVSYDPIVSLGSKIEWRYRYLNSKKPLAMIIRVDVYTDKGYSYTKSSYLVVSKITKNNICVVGKISSQTHQNELARKMAEVSHELPCVLNENTE